MSKFKYWAPAILYMALVFWLSSRPSPEQIRLIPIIAGLKVVHIIEYGFLYLLFWWALTNTTAFKWTGIFALALTFTVLYGMSDEFHQLFVASRTCRFMDVVADGVGGILVQGSISVFGMFSKRGAK
jgi:VanZ family protein